MPDRLDELRRQRALIQAHLDWLDREIASIGPASPAPSSAPVPAPTPRPVAAAPAAAAVPAPSVFAAKPTAATTGPEIEEFPEADPASMQNEARRGCLVYTVIGFVVFFGILTAIYFIGYRDHPLFRAEKPPTAETPVK